MLPLKRRHVVCLEMGEPSSSKFRPITLLDSDDEVEEVQVRTELIDLNLHLGVGRDGTPLERHQNIEFLDQDQAIAQLLAIFPELCPKHAANQLAQVPPNVPREQALQVVIEHYLTCGVTKPEVDVATPLGTEKVVSSSTINNPEDKESALEDDPFNLQEPAREAGIPYFHWCLFRMARDFPRVKMADLRQSLKSHKGRLGPAYRAVHYACRAALMKEGKLPASKGLVLEKEEGVKWLPKEGLKLMKHTRSQLKDSPGVACPVFEKEWTIVQKTFAKDQERFDEAVAKDLNEKEYESTGQEIECGCCCSDFPFEEMVQCADGHLFCIGCLRRRVEESTFGGLKACGSLPCMDTNGCTESFPWSEVKRALPVDVLLKYEQRQAEDAVARARLEGLVYCPFCNLPWEVDPGIQILECPNGACKKASCIKCKEPSHVPLRCEEVEKKSETCLRKRIEEVMTKALIRECSRCRAELVKNGGCNKITCRCGQTMCYVCRKPINKDYKHFCQHAREPGKACTQCNGCSLWQEEVEDEVVKAAKEAAMKEIEEQEPDFVKRTIGPEKDFQLRTQSLPSIIQPVARNPWQFNLHNNARNYDLQAPLDPFNLPWVVPENLDFAPFLFERLIPQPNAPANEAMQNIEAQNQVPVVARFHNLHNDLEN